MIENKQNKMINLKKITNVLVLVPDKHMGDLVLSLSAINALKEFFKEKCFYVVVDSTYTEIIETTDGIENLILYPRKQLNGNSFIKRLTILFDFLRQLRNTSPDIAIDLQGGIASSTMTFLSGAPLRVGRSTAKRPYFYNLKVNLSRGSHKLHSYADIVSAVGVQSEIGVPRIKASESKTAVLRNVLLKERINIEKPIVCIHPGAGKIFREWTSEGFAEISDWLSSKGFQVVFVGGNGDLDKTNEITPLLKHPSFNLGGRLSLGELIALFAISSLYIGNDSGPLHIASAVGTLPVIGLFFRPGADKTWSPLSKNSIILKGDAGCQKCKGNDCQYDFKCIRTISPDDVKIVIERLIRHPN